MFDRAKWAMCTSKRRYCGRRAAGKAAMRASERTGKAHRIYRCPYCELWHLTSAPKIDPEISVAPLGEASIQLP